MTHEKTTLTLYTMAGKPVEVTVVACPKFNESTGPGVSWAAWTWNPITGCLHDCDYCWARSFTLRFPNGFPAGFDPLFRPDRLAAPANTRIPAKHLGDPAYERCFVVSNGDMFGRWVPDEPIEQILAVERDNPQWQYLHLTKFPDRYPHLRLPATAWIGTSVDEQRRVRIAERAFRQVRDVKVTWLSLEPYKEDLRFSDLSMFDWVVIGAQTPSNQPDGPVPGFDPPAEWVLRITDQAKEAGCAVHWKLNLRKSLAGIAAPGDPNWFDEYPTSVRPAAA